MDLLAMPRAILTSIGAIWGSDDFIIDALSTS